VIFFPANFHKEDNYNQHLVPSFIHGLGFENQRPILVGRKKKGVGG
jgi:hypothetical protein